MDEKRFKNLVYEYVLLVCPYVCVSSGCEDKGKIRKYKFVAKTQFPHYI